MSCLGATKLAHRRLAAFLELVLPEVTGSCERSRQERLIPGFPNVLTTKQKEKVDEGAGRSEVV